MLRAEVAARSRWGLRQRGATDLVSGLPLIELVAALDVSQGKQALAGLLVHASGEAKRMDVSMAKQFHG